MVGAGVAVFAHSGSNALGRSPNDEGVEDPIAAAVSEVLVAEANTAQVIRVVRELEVVPPAT
jgi:hypothetical protein